MLFPKRFSDDWKFLLDPPRGCTFISVKKLGDVRIRMSLHEEMHVIPVMIPFLQRDVVIRLNMLEYLFQTFRYFSGNYFLTIFDD